MLADSNTATVPHRFASVASTSTSTSLIPIFWTPLSSACSSSLGYGLGHTLARTSNVRLGRLTLRRPLRAEQSVGCMFWDTLPCSYPGR